MSDKFKTGDLVKVIDSGSYDPYHSFALGSTVKILKRQPIKKYGVPAYKCTDDAGNTQDVFAVDLSPITVTK